MQKVTNLILAALCCAGAGMGYYAWQQQWIIITFTTHTPLQSSTTSTYTKKRTIIYWWRLDRWATESVEILWSTQQAHNAKQLIQAVLTLAADEHLINKKVVVERVLPHYQTNQLLVFFDQTPLSKHMAVRTKLMLIESILKTLRENRVKLSGLYFLANNQPLNDQHLDFRRAWPIEGFCHS